jgi:hypothetical protein
VSSIDEQTSNSNDKVINTHEKNDPQLDDDDDDDDDDR